LAAHLGLARTSPVAAGGRLGVKSRFRDDDEPGVACPDEETLLAFLDGRLSPQRVSEVDSHLSSCGDCGRVVADVAPVVLAVGEASPAALAQQTTLGRGASVGRYLLLDRVGRGGMGEVYAAYDPELDRKVAVKVLHEGAEHSEKADRARARLLREAKAIARLSHPNVVVVHDAGTIGERVFIAMEYVEGSTIADWLREAPRAWREIRDAFVAAGRGLEAAHRAGIVHRDFKPQNVMTSAGGAVRVMDFGLANEAGGGPAARFDAVGIGAATLALTRTESMVGTPAYMAPEQFRGERADARSDQFSFCVTAYEALYGERPFPSESFPALMEAVIAGRVREPAQKSGVPAWLRKVVLRGLRPDPKERWPSMTDLLAALGRDPQRRRRQALVAALVAALLLGGGAVAQRVLDRSDGALCLEGSAKLAELWDPPAGPGARGSSRREAARVAFAATGLSFAADTWARVSAALDRYAGRWTSAHAEACQATHVRREQSLEVLDLRMDCLNRGLDGLRALTDLFGKADREVVMSAVRATTELPDLARCDDVSDLRAVLPPPRDAQTRARVDALRARVAELKVLVDTGKQTEVIARGEALLAELRALGYDPLTSQAAFLVGYSHHAMGEAAGVAKSHLEEAALRALASRDDEGAVDAVGALAGTEMDEGERADDAERWLRIGEAILTRLGPGHDRARAWLEQSRGVIRYHQGRLAEGIAAFSTAAALKERARGRDHVDVAISLNALSVLLVEAGDLPRALATSERALAIATAAFGEGSPGLGEYLNNHGEVLNAAGRPAEALALFRRAMEAWEALGPGNQFQGHPLTGIGQALLREGKAAEAIAPLERALELRVSTNETHLRLGETRFALAKALWDGGGDRARARALALAARADQPRPERRAEVDRWLDLHSPPAVRAKFRNAAPGVPHRQRHGRAARAQHPGQVSSRP
jgi:tetratricopeptide (TPR) repeat protein